MQIGMFYQIQVPRPWKATSEAEHYREMLEQGYVVEAAHVYRADLGLDETLVRPSQHMGNVWSLHGYAECCRRLGHGDEAAAIALHLEQAQAVADIPIHASCFCRQVPECCEELHGSA